MKIHGVKREWSSPIFCMKKHDCPVCGRLLEKVKVSKVVNSRSEEAKDFDFSQAGGDGYMVGNVKFIWTEFHCARCDKNYKIQELKRLEKVR